MFKCNSCDKSYLSQKSLNKHNKQTHKISTELCYECQYENCQASFPAKLKLLQHLAQHKLQLKKAMKYACKVCAAKFIHKKSLYRHEKHKHGRNPKKDPDVSHKCRYCGIIFQDKTN
ncbi:hypothetical protein ABEB36_014579 [Hypothenemus hampei]|uniref:C2H2-type domain-containing protein n=1 Tax=Hypothenemus hampei TaxID=57062 RepID=A0ABD1E273_HYPHA